MNSQFIHFIDDEKMECWISLKDDQKNFQNPAKSGYKPGTLRQEDRDSTNFTKHIAFFSYILMIMTPFN